MTDLATSLREVSKRLRKSGSMKNIANLMENAANEIESLSEQLSEYNSTTPCVWNVYSNTWVPHSDFES